MATPGRRFQLTFRILDERGRTVRDFDVKHTKRLHLVVVRRDMIDFQHLHPTQVADGSWATPLTLHAHSARSPGALFTVWRHSLGPAGCAQSSTTSAWPCWWTSSVRHRDEVARHARLPRGRPAHRQIRVARRISSVPKRLQIAEDTQPKGANMTIANNSLHERTR